MFEKPPLQNTAEKPKDSVLRIDLNSKETYKKESEDASYVDADKGIFVASDGITRGPYENTDEYPSPSPASAVAKAATEAIGKHLSSLPTISEQDLLDAAEKGNAAARTINEQLGLWQSNDYLKRDLAGTVTAYFVHQDDKCLFAYMGDCGVAKIDAHGRLAFASPDEIAPIRPHFPKTEKVGTQERFVSVRRDFRNKPNADHPTYGALTGEPEALSYVRVGSFELNPGETAVAYSDGITPFLQDESFRKLVRIGDTAQITKFLEDRSSASKHADDKTLVVKRSL